MLGQWLGQYSGDWFGSVQSEQSYGGSGWISYYKTKIGKHKLDSLLDEVVKEIYESNTGENASSEVRKASSALVKPYSSRKSRKSEKIVPTQTVDWLAISTDLEVAQKLFELWKMDMIRREDDEIMSIYVSRYM